MNSELSIFEGALIIALLAPLARSMDIDKLELSLHILDRIVLHLAADAQRVVYKTYMHYYVVYAVPPVSSINVWYEHKHVSPQWVRVK